MKSDFNFTPLKGYENFEATTQIIIAEILRRRLPFEIIDPDNNLIAVKYNNREYIIHEGTISDANSLIAYWISNDKWMTKQFLSRSGIRHAKGTLLKAGDEHDKAGLPPFPLVVKPFNTDHGIAVTAGITDGAQLVQALDRAFRHSGKVIVEEYFPGREYRFLVVDGVVRAVAYRDPANVTGDGEATIRELIDWKNLGRGDDYRYPLLKIKVDEEVERNLEELGLTLSSVPDKGQKVYLRKNSNLSTGGDSIDVTDTIADFYKKVAARAAQAANLRLAGIDIIIRDPDAAPSEDGYIVVELNAPAMLSMHDFPWSGKNRNVEKYVLDCIFNIKSND